MAGMAGIALSHESHELVSRLDRIMWSQTAVEEIAQAETAQVVVVMAAQCLKNQDQSYRMIMVMGLGLLPAHLVHEHIFSLWYFFQSLSSDTSSPIATYLSTPY